MLAVRTLPVYPGCLWAYIRRTMHERPLLRRGTSWAMLALYSFVASGVPLPLGLPPADTAAAKRIASKDRSKPFPCMDKACGCDTAERCFTNCCCHTPAETLAWAKARGIEPSVIDALTRRVAASALPLEGTASPCCEAASKARAAVCCLAEDDRPDEAICSDYQSLAAEPTTTSCSDVVTTEPERAPDEREAAPRVVILRAMLACGGIVAQWSAMGVSLPPPAIVTCRLLWPQVGVLRLDDAAVLGTGSPPDLPPPRV